ncbi:MAG: hypothetical protein EXX96DRAFT_537822 [Benjaminiella poitrasii]|nr:MAG: hypothetical protein EXX96DRAFT_537822 [Benjaminiella poitrasii]
MEKMEKWKSVTRKLTEAKPKKYAYQKYLKNVELAVHDTPVSVAAKSPFVQDILKSSANTSNSSADVLPLNMCPDAFTTFNSKSREDSTKAERIRIYTNTSHSTNAKNLRIHILDSITRQMFPSAIKEKLEGIVHNLIDSISNTIACDSGQSSCLVASCKITALIKEDAAFNSTNRILLAIRNMVEALPRFVIEDGPRGIELIIPYLQAALVPLFENIDDKISSCIMEDIIDQHNSSFFEVVLIIASGP